MADILASLSGAEVAVFGGARGLGAAIAAGSSVTRAAASS